MNNIGTIYKATNLINGKIYIGQTIKSLARRQYEHFYYKNRDNSKFRTALRKYKPEDWKWEILVENIPAEQLNDLERAYIWGLSSYEFGYNSTRGGDENPMNGRNHTEETKQKMSKAHLGQKLSEAHKRKLILSRIGVPHSEETKLKISVANKGKIRTENFKKQVSLNKKGENNHNFGKPLAQQVKDKIASSRATVNYKITKPAAATEVVKNLRKYCREHKLTFSHMYEIIKTGLSSRKSK